MTGLVVAALACVAATPAGIVYLIMRGRLNAARGLFAYASGSWKAEKRELLGLVDDLDVQNASLRARNEFLVGLVGADAERAALNGSCTDEAGWGR